MGIFSRIFELQDKGMSLDQIDEHFEKNARKESKKKGKIWGECESCGMETCLVEEVGLCGPCCFGEAETFAGNW